MLANWQNHHSSWHFVPSCSPQETERAIIWRLKLSRQACLLSHPRDWSCSKPRYICRMHAAWWNSYVQDAETSIPVSITCLTTIFESRPRHDGRQPVRVNFSPNLRWSTWTVAGKLDFVEFCCRPRVMTIGWTSVGLQNVGLWKLITAVYVLPTCCRTSVYTSRLVCSTTYPNDRLMCYAQSCKACIYFDR